MSNKNKAQLMADVHKFEKRLGRTLTVLNTDHETLKGLREKVTELKWTLMEQGKLTKHESHLYGKPATVETLMQKEAGNVLGMFVQNPEAHLKDLAEHSEMTVPQITAFLKRMKEKAPLVIDAGKDMNSKQMATALNEKIRTALYYMDESVFAKATLKDLGYFTSLMIDKMRLLQGEPTQILSMGERKELNDMLPDLLNEVKKRGLTVTVSEDIKVIEGETVES